MSVKPWNDWYHCIGNTYGTWLRGDERGWRARHHRQHVEGDYRHPPPDGAYEDQLRQSRRAMKRGVVVFTPVQRPIVCRQFGDALLFYQVGFVDLSVGATHFHTLARFTACTVESPPPPGGGDPRPGGRGLSEKRHPSAYDVDPLPRTVLGRVRSYTTRELKETGHFSNRKGGLWAKRPKIVPIECEEHFRFVGEQYIPGHAREGAAVWSMLDRG